MCLNKINESTKLYTIIKSNLLLSTTTETVCVNIHFPRDYDAYFAGLSKSVRQNIRTSKNRMLRENICWHMEFFNGNIPKNVHEKAMQVYNKRTEEREGRKSSAFAEFIRNNINPISVALEKTDTSFAAVLYIENNVAAYMSGFFNSTSTVIIVPRLAIDSSWGVYCPGSILISETIRYLIENTLVENLDLSRGNEKYKYAMGGNEHYNIDVMIKA